MATISEQHREVVRSRLVQELKQLDRTHRMIVMLLECEHPDWGDPGAEAAHEAALSIVRGAFRTRPKLSPQEISEIRKKDRERAGLNRSIAQPPSHKFSQSNGLVRPARSLQPSSLEITKDKHIAPNRPDPKDIALPMDDDDNLQVQQPQLSTPLCSDASVSCATLTNRAHAEAMRRLDRCAITPSGLAQLETKRATVWNRISQIDAAQKELETKLNARARERWQRLKRPQCFKGASLSISRGRGSRLSSYTAIDDADDPFGERNARCEREALWEPEFRHRDREPSGTSDAEEVVNLEMDEKSPRVGGEDDRNQNQTRGSGATPGRLEAEIETPAPGV
ncbi:hypothetical protein DL766_006016 [Monosporascus sp. MC13-8B]|uniref:Uncharacterized protein n=1 Tax=Monosporascus cannonballus TaxID=155416 RepID=A0ABY0H240_9PEZI|nr:hypothetical protein DL762_007969 [Monosporascus cannonballus]RYP28208.1 hypothetical protein DL766_006016 [Monosporascus sp. MC13-8B]